MRWEGLHEHDYMMSNCLVGCGAELNRRDSASKLREEGENLIGCSIKQKKIVGVGRINEHAVIVGGFIGSCDRNLYGRSARHSHARKEIAKAAGKEVEED